MSRVGFKMRWVVVPLMTWGLAACSAAEEVTTSSVQPAQGTAIAEPDCGSLKTEIDKLNAAKLPEKLQQASATGTKKYNPTPDEWAAFPRYNNLVETYTVKKCEPALQQAKAGTAKPKAKTAAAPGKTADAGAAMKAAASKAAATAGTATPAKVSKAATAAAASQEAAQQPAYQGVTLQIPPAAPEQKQ